MKVEAAEELMQRYLDDSQEAWDGLLETKNINSLWTLQNSDAEMYLAERWADGTNATTGRHFGRGNKATIKRVPILPPKGEPEIGATTYRLQCMAKWIRRVNTVAKWTSRTGPFTQKQTWEQQRQQTSRQ